MENHYRREPTMITSNDIARADEELRERYGSYEVFERDGMIYVSFPKDESESEDPCAPCAVIACALEDCEGYGDLLRECVSASNKVDALVVSRENGLDAEWL